MSNVVLKTLTSALLLALLIAIPSSAQSSPQRPSKAEIKDCFGYDWPKQEVPWIITPEEQAAFYKLRNDEEREQFIEQFWSRRDPTPDSLDNEYQNTYYERMLYANQHFSSPAEPGWRTPGGRIYVMYGLPDSEAMTVGIPQLPSSAVVLSDKCTTISLHNGLFDMWQYRKIADLDHAAKIVFADACGTGEFLPLVEKSGAVWLSRSPKPHYKPECNGKYDPNQPHNGIVAIICMDNPPRVQFKDLEEIVSHKVNYTLVPVEIHTSFEKITPLTDMLQFSLSAKDSDVSWKASGTLPHAPVQIFGRFTTITGRIA